MDFNFWMLRRPAFGRPMLWTSLNVIFSKSWWSFRNCIQIYLSGKLNFPDSVPGQPTILETTLHFNYCTSLSWPAILPLLWCMAQWNKKCLKITKTAILAKKKWTLVIKHYISRVEYVLSWLFVNISHKNLRFEKLKKLAYSWEKALCMNTP